VVGVHRQSRRDRVSDRTLPGSNLHELRPDRHLDRDDIQQHGLTSATAYRYRVRANDAAGNLSGYSPVATATTAAGADTSAPTAPSSLTATASGTGTVNLAWSTSTDNVGVTGYRIERCQGATCTNYAQIATSIGTTFSNTG
jgi:chitodextrinase